MRSQKFIRYFEGASEHSFAWLSLILAGGSDGLKDRDSKSHGLKGIAFWAVAFALTTFYACLLGPDAFVAAFCAIAVGLAVVDLARNAEGLQQKAKQIRDSLHDSDNFATAQLKRSLQRSLIELEMRQLDARELCLLAAQSSFGSLQRLPHLALSPRLLPTPNLAGA